MKKLINYYAKEEQTIKEAMSVIQSNLSRCVIVLNKANKVVGVFSEGDVLRAILKGIDIYTPLKEVINPRFHYLKEHDIQKAYRMVKKFNITSIIPVVDRNLKLKDVITIFDVLEHLALTNEKSK